ncbi:MAG: hypothetical protein LBD67_02400 [Candidatus Accumulibacter sp.]|jgi:hypothetical protein|nr:hypothetical protein [Accumulibacter sp.]
MKIPRALKGLFDLSPRHYRLNRSGFSADARRLRGDFAAIGRDLKKQMPFASKKKNLPESGFQ